MQVALRATLAVYPPNVTWLSPHAMQVAEAKTARAEASAETLQLQVDVTAAERGAEICKLEVARDESLQAAAAPR